MVSEINIREACTEDLPEMLAIYNDLILHITAVYSDQPHTLEMRKAWLESKQEQRLPVYVATSADKLMGFATYGPFRSWPGYRFTVENSVYVAADARGKGIGRFLMEVIIQKAAAQDYHAMVAGIDADNQVSIRLHEKLGFKQVAHFREVGYKFNRWLDLVFMELVLQQD